MKLLRVGIAAALLAGVVGVAMVAQTAAPVGARMADAAGEFLASLSPELKQKAAFPVDSEERLNWHFIPMQDKQRRPTRKGVGLFEMNDAQRKAAMGLLKAGTSDKGYTQATTIMSLEAILRELEKGRGAVRDPQWYFVTVFGEPSKTGKWGWRIEGHHLSINFLIDKGEVVSTTPYFFGANPALIMTGPNKGDRTLEAVEELAFKLFNSLDENQRKVAHRPEHFPEISQTPRAQVGDPVGLPAEKMTDAQRGILTELLEAYATRMPPALAREEMKRVRDAGLGKVHFAFTGEAEQGKAHTYRVQGPTFVVEFLNVQSDAQGNPANHIHSAWRRLPADFGLEAGK